MSYVSKKKREERFQVITQAQAIINKPGAGTAEGETFDRMMADADLLMSLIERDEKAGNQVNAMSEIIGASAEKHNVSFGEQENAVKRYTDGFTAHLRAQYGIPLDAKNRAALDDYRAAASVGTSSAGGILVPTELMQEIYTAMIAEGGVRSVAKIMQTAQGNPIVIPQNDDTGQVAVIVAENTSYGTGTDLGFTSVTLGAYKYTSGVMLISKELLQDSAFNFQAFVQEQLVHRFTRGTNAHYTTGNGTTQPQGVITAAGLGATGITGETTSLIYQDLVTLEHSVGIPYRKNAKFMMADGVFKAIKRLTDTLGRPLWLPNITVGAPDSLLGYPIVLNPDMAAPVASAKSILFGDFSQFIIRDCLALDLNVLNELYATTGQIGVVGLMRTDSKLAATGNVLKYFAQAAS